MRTQYTHTRLDEDIHSISGFYTPLKEVRLRHGDREVLYVVGRATAESACCGTGTFAYAIVPGYIMAWKSDHNQRGLAVSQVETVEDKETQHEIARMVGEAEGINNVTLW